MADFPDRIWPRELTRWYFRIRRKVVRRQILGRATQMKSIKYIILESIQGIDHWIIFTVMLCLNNLPQKSQAKILVTPLSLVPIRIIPRQIEDKVIGTKSIAALLAGSDPASSTTTIPDQKAKPVAQIRELIDLSRWARRLTVIRRVLAIKGIE